MGWPQSDLDSQLALHLKWISAEPEEEFNLLEIMNLLNKKSNPFGQNIGKLICLFLFFETKMIVKDCLV